MAERAGAEAAATLIDGTALAAEMRAALAVKIARLKKRHGLTPALAVVLVGEDPASEIYVRSKERAAERAGMRSLDVRFPATADAHEVEAAVAALSADASVHGILVQLPLPAQIAPGMLMNAVDPAKDVDGFHALNVGRLWSGEAGLVPCTPMGCLYLLKRYAGGLAGKDALIVGRSAIVGRPLAALLLDQDCTVTLAHSRSRALAATARRADILIAVVGQAELVRGDWIKPGAVVIDVGVNRVEQPDGSARLVGDVAFAEAVGVAGAITPVPGGVGPMTIACVLENTYRAACAQAGVAEE